MKKESSILIRAAQDKVFDALTNDENVKRWMGGEIQTKFENVGDPDNLVGRKFTEVVGGVLEFKGEVIAFERPRVFASGVTAGPLRGTIQYTLEPASNGNTNLTFTVDFFDSNAAAKLFLNTSYPLFQKYIDKQLKNIKDLAEKA